MIRKATLHQVDSATRGVLEEILVLKEEHTDDPASLICVESIAEVSEL